MNLVEKNQAALKKAIWGNKEFVEIDAKFKRSFGFSCEDKENFPIQESGFSFLEAKKILESNENFKEADTSSGFSQLLRAGIQQSINLAMYEQVGVTYEQWAHVIPSKLDTELYAPLTGLNFLREIPRGGKYGESGLYGLDMKLQNRKYGTLHAAAWELCEDDQTGQVLSSSRLLGEYVKILFEALCYAKLASVSGMTYAELTVPQSETQPSNETTWPFHTSLVGGGANRPGSFGAVTGPNIQSAFIGLNQQKNQLGLKMQVSPDTVIASTVYEFDLATIANSTYYPTNVYNSSAPQAAGSVGGPMAINTLQGRFKPLISKFIFKNDGTVNGDSHAWYAMDTKKPWFVLQLREPATVVAEAPNSGAGFETDTMRFKVRVRGNADHIEPRFCWQGNDGSV